MPSVVCAAKPVMRRVTVKLPATTQHRRSQNGVQAPQHTQLRHVISLNAVTLCRALHDACPRGCAAHFVPIVRSTLPLVIPHLQHGHNLRNSSGVRGVWSPRPCPVWPAAQAAWLLPVLHGRNA
jgi:hypothetical protein